ncbi:MAG TPA: STAS/SEC14 domain-containing protein [Candidatus Saccharimonas sp.]|nr:STAS/SEC14 domain-containing protein [Candidatus Saccharimonas sp.]
MVNKVFVDADGLLQILVVGDQTQESVREMGEKLGFYVRQLRDEGRPVLVLDNLLQMGETTSEARGEVARIARGLDFDRGAMVGDNSPLMRHGTNLMLRAIGRSNLRFFSNLDSAKRWLLR